ncbi:MAG: tetratricopeptide repeat protein [Pyrinomonadaceae bacterium]
MSRKQTVLLGITFVALLVGAIYVVAARRHAVAVAKPPATRQDEAVAFTEARIAAQPDDSEAYRLHAAALVMRAEATGDGADYDRAWQQLERAEKYDPGSLRLIQARAVLSMSRHHFGQAQTIAEQGLSVQPTNADLLGLAGDGALESGNLDAADKYYSKLVEVASRTPSSWARLAHLAEVRGDLEEAVKLMEKSIDASYPKPLSSSGFAWSRAIVGEIEAKRGRLDEARRQYRWALVKYANHPLAVEFLADLDQWQGKLDEAEAGYRKLLALKPDPKYKASLADLLERRGQKEEAARLRDEAFRFYQWSVGTGNEGYLRPLATMELKAGRYQSAAELAMRDLALRPTPESRALYAGILQTAREAGQPLAGFAALAPRDVPAASPVAISSR